MTHIFCFKKRERSNVDCVVEQLGMISHSELEQCTMYSFPGDCHEDKEMRLQQGHHGELSSRLQDEDLENMFSSLTTDDILSQGASGCANYHLMQLSVLNWNNVHYSFFPRRRSRGQEEEIT
jgi:hypothetical protein